MGTRPHRSSAFAAHRLCRSTCTPGAAESQLGRKAVVSLCGFTFFSSSGVQVGKSGHSSVEDAQATMVLYNLVEVELEQHLAQNPPKD